jgi:hypothetical protein
MTLAEIQAIRERDAAELRGIADLYLALGRHTRDGSLKSVCRDQSERLRQTADKLEPKADSGKLTAEMKEAA